MQKRELYQEWRGQVRLDTLPGQPRTGRCVKRTRRLTPHHGDIESRHLNVGSAYAHVGPSAGIAQLVEHDLAKVGVASSNLVSRSNLFNDLQPGGIKHSEP